VLVRFNHAASFIVNANHSIMRASVKLRVSNCVRNFGVPQATEWQCIGEQIDARLKIRNGGLHKCWFELCHGFGFTIAVVGALAVASQAKTGWSAVHGIKTILDGIARAGRS